APACTVSSGPASRRASVLPLRLGSDTYLTGPLSDAPSTWAAGRPVVPYQICEGSPAVIGLGAFPTSVTSKPALCSAVAVVWASPPTVLALNTCTGICAGGMAGAVVVVVLDGLGLGSPIRLKASIMVV